VDTAPAPDPLQGLDYMHARYYSFRTGRFLSVDPVGGEVGLSQSWNRYAYVLGNPIGAMDPDGTLEVLAIKVHNGYVYTIIFDSKLERVNRAAEATKSLVMRGLGVAKKVQRWVGWGGKALQKVDTVFRGEPVRVFGEDTGVPAVSGPLDGPRFERMIKKEFFKLTSYKEFYGKRSREALRRAIAAVVDRLVSEHKISGDDAVKILRVYDARNIFEQAERQAAPDLEEWLVGSGSTVMDDGTAASTIVRCNGAYKFANQCR
jgi:RHS repeat-associated protein